MNSLQGRYIIVVLLLNLTAVSYAAMVLDPHHFEGGFDSDSFEVIGAGIVAEATSMHENTQAETARASPHTRPRRSPHMHKWTKYGVGSYHGQYPPNHYGGWQSHHGHGGPSNSFSNSHAQAQSVSANFGSKGWEAGFSGSAASAGSGAGTQNHLLGYHHRK